MKPMFEFSVKLVINLAEDVTFCQLQSISTLGR